MLAGEVRRGELPEPASGWCALGSGGTAAGLARGLRLAGLRTRVCAVHVNDGLRLTERTVLRLARRVPLAGSDAVNAVEVVHGYLGAGYGHGTEAARRAIERARETEGLALDPVYTGKAMAAVLDHTARGEGPTLFWNTYNGVDAG